MSTDEYVPEEDDVRMAYIEAHVDMADPITRRQRAQAEREAEDAWAAFLARVRRDAAAEARIAEEKRLRMKATATATEAEARIARLEAQTSIRGRAVIMYRERAREAEAAVENWRKQYEYDIDYWVEEAETAEARIKAVRDLCDAREDPDQWPPHNRLHGGAPMPASLMVRDVRRALEG